MSRNIVTLKFEPEQGKPKSHEIHLIIKDENDKKVTYYDGSRSKEIDASQLHDIIGHEFLKSYRVEIEGVRFTLLSRDSTLVDVDVLDKASCSRYGRLSRSTGEFCSE